MTFCYTYVKKIQNKQTFFSRLKQTKCDRNFYFIQNTDYCSILTRLTFSHGYYCSEICGVRNYHHIYVFKILYFLKGKEILTRTKLNKFYLLLNIYCE